MSQFLDRLRQGPLLADGATGSYLFRKTGRLSERNHVYEALNLDNPDLIREVHLAYLRAGARCLTTNSFGGNRSILRANGEQNRLTEINRRSVELARETIGFYRSSQKSDEDLFILASLGPQHAATTGRTLQEDYEEQVEALSYESPDAFILETFSSIEEVIDLAGFIRERTSIPIIAELALHRDGDHVWNQSPTQFLRVAAELGIPVAGINCCAPWDALAFLDEVETQEKGLKDRVFLSVMPNAGGFQRIGNRYMTRVNPEFMGGLTRTLAARGVRLIGGCCEVHPGHLREMHNYLLGHVAGTHPAATAEPASGPGRLSPVGKDLKCLNGPFSRKLFSGEFVVSVELVPPRGTSPQILNSRVALVEALADSGLTDAVDITDGSRGIPMMPAADFIAVARERLGWGARLGDRIEFIPHFTCRDLNIMGLQSRLIGLHSQEIHNLLCITGDPPKMSPTYPRSTAVFDANSVSLISYVARHLNAGLDFGGESLARSGDPRTRFTVGSGFEPEALDLERELDKLRRKLDAGADYIMTQPVFRPETLAGLEPFRSRIPILTGVLILTGLDHARRIAEVPGVVIPEAVFRRFERYSQNDDQLKSGIDLAIEQAREFRQSGWPGLYLMSPASSGPILRVLEGALA